MNLVFITIDGARQDRIINCKNFKTLLFVLIVNVQEPITKWFYSQLKNAIPFVRKNQEFVLQEKDACFLLLFPVFSFQLNNAYRGSKIKCKN